MVGGAGESVRRERYERLYAEYRDARRAHDEARARGAPAGELHRLRERMRVLRERLTLWRRGTSAGAA